MKSLLRHFAITLLCLTLLGYMGFLLRDLYKSRSELQQSARTRLLDDTEKRAMAIGYFFTERLNDFQDLSENRELSAYFENLALGMSMEYGLAASLEDANSSFARFRQKKMLGGLTIFKRLVFLDNTGHKLLDSLQDTQYQARDEEKNWRPFLSRDRSKPTFYVSSQYTEALIIISMPYIAKGKFSGFILAWLSPSEISKHFLTGLSSQKNPIALMFENRYLYIPAESSQLISRELLEQAKSSKDNTIIKVPTANTNDAQHEFAVFKTPIQFTPFSLLTLVPATDATISSPGRLVTVSAAIGALILIGSFVIIQNGTRSRVLNARIEEIHIREQETQKQNLLLQKATQAAEDAMYVAETARVLAEASERAKSDSEERLKLVLDGSNDGIWDWDVQCGRIDFNHRWANMLGYEPGEIQHNVQSWWDMIHPDDSSAVRKNLDEHLAGRTPFYESEHRVRTKDNRWLWILDRGKVVLRDQSGAPLRAAGTHSDISTRKNFETQLYEKTELLELEMAERQMAQEALAVKQSQLEALNNSLQARVEETVAELRQKDQMLISQSRQAAMGEMIGNIAHQWRQPINALAMLLINIQQSYQFNEMTAEYLDKSVMEGNRLIQKMSTTINDFRNFFMPDKEAVLFSARDQINSAVTLVESAFKSKNISIALEAENDLMLTGFPNEYSQVLLNLLSNAKDAITSCDGLEGKVTIRLYQRDAFGCVTVSDNGGGIDAQVIDKIFEPYFSTKSMGTGIGLYMSKMIIEKSMNGTIEARNSQGGAEFTVASPLERELG